MKVHAGGLYSGYVPNLIRNSIISSSELVSYDTSKRQYAHMGVPDGPGLHMMAGLTAGLVATVLGNPMDVVSTRIMVRKSMGHTAGMVQTCKDMVAGEGILSFYQGFVPNFARIGAFNVVLWMSLEQISSLVG
jgi:solute carrier family 25 (mitochondrial uncoupling protein), member 8/9